ncbi:hypothetical protein TrVFT333_006809 [Trichoderma virens FT-333]|nr:hypothetical protein TrVFT333_006809 [Trichoderma virens FT-333]
MTINASHIRTEIINTVTEILQSLQCYPENNINILKPLLHALRITRRAIANPGKELPRTELQWCEKLQTIAPLEASTPSENHSMTDAATRDNTQDASIANNFLAADATTQDAPSTTDTQDAPSTTDTTTQDAPSTTDTTTQDAPSTTDTQGDASATQDATTQDAPSTTDTTTQDAPSTTDTTTQDAPSTTDTQDDASTTQDTSITEKTKLFTKKSQSLR